MNYGVLLNYSSYFYPLFRKRKIISCIRTLFRTHISNIYKKNIHSLILEGALGKIPYIFFVNPSLRSIFNSNNIKLKSKRMHFLFNGHIKRLKLLTTAKKPRFRKLTAILKKKHYFSMTNLVKKRILCHNFLLTSSISALLILLSWRDCFNYFLTNC